MLQDKDRAGKWLLVHHGDSFLRLAGITGFTSWRAVAPETVAPRRLPDGVLEVQFPGVADPTLVLVEVETYPDADADRQVFDGLVLIALERKAVPEVLSLVLRPKGNLTVGGRAERTSPSGRVRLGGSWPVVRLWELDAEALLAADDPGLLPWVPLARSADPPEVVVARVGERVQAVPDPTDRNGLIGALDIMAGLAYPGRDFKHLYGGRPMLEKVMQTLILETPEYRALLFEHFRPELEARRAEGRAEGQAEGRAEGQAEGRAEGRVQTLREGIVAILTARFAPLPAERVAALSAVADEDRLRALQVLAATCPDLDTFAAELTRGS